MATETHPTDTLLQLLEALVRRVSWHSEAQQNDAMGLLRSTEEALKGDQHSADTAVVTAPAWVPEHSDPAVAELNRQLAAAKGPEIDYDKLAEAMERARAAHEAKQAAADEEPAEEAPSAEPSPAPAGFVLGTPAAG